MRRVANVRHTLEELYVDVSSPTGSNFNWVHATTGLETVSVVVLTVYTAVLKRQTNSERMFKLISLSRHICLLLLREKSSPISRKIICLVIDRLQRFYFSYLSLGFLPNNLLQSHFFFYVWKILPFFFSLILAGFFDILQRAMYCVVCSRYVSQFRKSKKTKRDEGSVRYFLL